jgi:uncharacterized protein
MLSFDIRSLETKAAQVDGSVGPDDPIWEKGDSRPAGPIRITGRLSSASEGRFYFTGRMEGRIQLPCRLCLEEVEAEIDEDIHFLLAGIGAEEADDPEVFLYDPNAVSIDLRPAVRETWLLSVPQYVQCSEACKGLCPNCGTNLNESTCNCSTNETDPRWDALRKLQSKTH